MDRPSTDCRLLYEIIGSRGRARAIQAPTPATDSGSNRERETEKREARADIAAAARSHAHHTERVSTRTAFPEAHSDTAVEGKAGDGRSDNPSSLANGGSRATRRDAARSRGRDVRESLDKTSAGGSIPFNLPAISLFPTVLVPLDPTSRVFSGAIIK